MPDPNTIAAAAVRYVTGQTGGQLPPELADLADAERHRVIRAAARAAAAASITTPYRPRTPGSSPK